MTAEEVALEGREQLRKTPTGIDGFDAITNGGLPTGRPTLVCGGAGCGKTLFAMEFIVRGAAEFNEPGVFVSFEESEGDLIQNVASLGFDLNGLMKRKLLYLDHVNVVKSEIEETGEYDLEGLFIRLGYAIDSIGAKRVALDTIESLFSGLSNPAILRAELRRLFAWLKKKGVTAVITGERGEGQLTRQGLEEYVSDCVLLLDHRVQNEVSTRRLRIVKYRGSTHGTNEYPFLIGEEGFSVLPITSLGLAHGASSERVSIGVPAIDEMLGGKGLFRGSSVLVSGTSGTGKSSICAYFANATCLRGERCIYFAFEESPGQIIRNMRSIGLDLQPWIDKGLLFIESARPMHLGLEMHLTRMQQLITHSGVQSVVVDPVSNLDLVGSIRDVQAMLIRLVDVMKSRGVTALFSNLTGGGKALEATDLGMSSLMDTWILLRDIEYQGERNRGIYVLKSRGMPHSNQIREYTFGSDGINLRDVYLGPEGVLTGSARVEQEFRERTREEAAFREAKRKKLEAQKRRTALEAQLAAVQAEIESERLELERLDFEESERASRNEKALHAMSKSRGGPSPRGENP